MVKENVIAIIDILNSDEATAKQFLGLSPEEAVVAFKNKGIDCTVEDLVELANELKALKVGSDDLDASDLENVTGGGWGSFLTGCGCGAAVVALAVYAPW